MENTKLFVYGTLKKGFGNHRLIQKTEYVGDFISNDKFDLSGHSFPEIYPNDHGKQIKGEVYNMEEQDFIITDSLESNGYFYNREIRSFYNGKKEIKAWIYIIMQPGAAIEIPDRIIDWNYNYTRNSSYI